MHKELPERKADQRSQQRSEAIREKEAFLSLTTNPGWKRLDAWMSEQIRTRTQQIILQPCTGLKSQLEQEYTKGEIAAMMMLQKVAEVGLEAASAVVRSLNDEQRTDDGAGDSGADGDRYE